MVLKCIILLAQFYVMESLLLNESKCELLFMEYGNEANYLRCEGDFFQAENLKEHLQNITEIIDTFELYNATMDALPQDLFNNMENVMIRKFIISHSSIELLSIPELGVLPFKSVEDTLETFEIYNSSFVFAWEIPELASLEKLKTLIIEDSVMLEVKEGFDYLPNLRFIQFINAGIRWIHQKVFQSNEHLTICSLSQNYISSLHRSTFPRPAKHLWSLDLSYNELTELPHDMFEDMPSLQELKLDNNKLKSITSKLLKPAYENLYHLWLDGNKEICWSLCWIARKEYRPPWFLDSSKCYTAIGEKLVPLDSFYKRCNN